MCVPADSNLQLAENVLELKEPKTKDNIEQSPKGWGTRHTFLVLGFVGFALCYALRFNLSIAIVKMIKRSNGTVGAGKGGNLTMPDHEAAICPLGLMPKTNSSQFNYSNATLVDENNNDYESEKFDWSEEEQQILLGAFFWGYVLTQFPGGKLSHVYGPKWIFSGGILITGILSLFIPIVTIAYEYYGLIVIRVAQGLAEGVTLPSILVLLARWAPIGERSRMVNWLYAGIPLGTAVTMVAGGYLLHFFGWPSVFYVAGGLTLVWFVFWSFFVYNDPSEHPRITEEELNYIQSHLEGESMTDNIATPWCEIVKSLPVWAVLITDLGDSWSHYLLHVEVPMYLSSVHNFDIETDGWLSASPQVVNFGVGILLGYLADFLINRKYLSVISTRKLCSTIALWGAAGGFIGMIYGGCDTPMAVASLNFAAGIAGASNSGWTLGHIEIAPNHAGTISGIANMFGNCLGFVAPLVTGLILEKNPTLRGWRIALSIPAGISFAVSLFYLAFASSDVQPWNRITEEEQESKIRKDSVTLAV
ncbi:Sialin [Folsomia candida]|uniref:Sialin n=2 Tax=Folsomia candida TaxID=158441 RepID=A0A226E5W4_FOLCA|nr:Sialin [Folsomia candida]